MDIPIFISSNSGNSITQYFNPPIVLRNKKRYTLTVINATMFFTFPNIFSSGANQNNILNFTANATQYKITVPQGLYDISTLSTLISNSLQNLGLSSSLIVLSGDNPTQRSVIQLNNATCSINFATSNIRTILGFNAVTIGPGTSGQFYYSNNRADFNTLSEVLLHASCCSGFRNNTNEISSNSDVIGSVVINCGVSQQIVYDPNQAIKVPIFQSILDRVQFYYTDQDNNALVNNEPWTITAVIQEEGEKEHYQ